MQPFIGGQLARFRAAGPRVSARLCGAGPIPRRGIPAAVPLRPEPVPPTISPTAERVSVDLTHDRRRGTPQPPPDLPNAFPPGNAVLNLVALVFTEPRPLPRTGLVTEF